VLPNSLRKDGVRFCRDWSGQPVDINRANLPN
jgi:hypothetical protein